jgi:transcriptional regulator with PAS, ATPase and Fis domain
MTQSICEILADAEQLLQDRKYDEVLKKLGEVDPSFLTREEDGYGRILRSEALLHKRDYAAPNLAEDINRAIEIFRFGDNERFARAKLLLGWYLSELHDLIEAKEVLLAAHYSYCRCNNLPKAAAALNRLARCNGLTGDFEASVRNLKNSMAIYDELSDNVSKAHVAHNLAVVQLMAGDLNKCFSTYASYPITAETHGKQRVLNYWSMSSLYHAFKGDIDTAKKTISQCVPTIDNYPHDKAVYFENLGQILLLDKDYAPAEDALKSGLEISLPGTALVSQIKRLLADLYVATGKFDLAKQYATEGLKVARKIRERKEIAAYYRIFAQIKQHDGDEKKARKWYKKAIELFDLIRSRYELAVTRYLAATSGLFSNEERTTMLCLAKEYFESEHVTHYVKKIDAEFYKVVLPQSDVVKTRPTGRSGNTCPTIICRSPQMKEVVRLLHKVASPDLAVLLTGATGTGKGLCAEFIHYHSPRRGGPFVTANVQAYPDSLLESLLFGHKKGSFTNAVCDQHGLIEAADGGTLFLDEIGDAPLHCQAKILEVMDKKVVRPLGSTKLINVDFRLIAATNQDLDELMKKKLFRVDLFYRLNVFPIRLPSLDEHKDDIPLLVEHFLTCGDFSLTNGNAMKIERLGRILSQRSWEGNVRELENYLERLHALTDGDVAEMINVALKDGVRPKCEDNRLTSEELREALELTKGNQRAAARRLGISEATLRYYMRKYGFK